MGRLIPLAAIGAGLYLALSSDEANQGSEIPRGIRNNNPGNVEKGAQWQGLAEDQSQDDRFAVFSDAVWGIRAMARILDTYRQEHDLQSVAEIIRRWAPATENNTREYAEHVAERVGVAPSDPLPEDTTTKRRMIAAMIEHENGMQPYPGTLIRRGIAKA